MEIQQATKRPSQTSNKTESDGLSIIDRLRIVADKASGKTTRGGVEAFRTQLHQGFGIPGGTVESSLYLSKGVHMLYRDDGLWCSFKGKDFVVPLADVIVCHL